MTTTNEGTGVSDAEESKESEVDFTPDDGSSPTEIHYKGENLRDPAPRSTRQGIGEWVGIIVAALFLAFLIKTYVVQTFYIPSASMEHTLNINDRLLVNKLTYRFGNIHRGDIIVFKRPPGETDKSLGDLIKRVIAVPGDTIEARNGLVYLNGKPLSEPYLIAPGTPTNNLPLTTIKPGELWVMGDNRTDSSDSRVFGPIEQNTVVGKAQFRIWPFSRFGTLH